MVTVKAIPTKKVFSVSEPDEVAPLFKQSSDTIVPSKAELEAFAEEVASSNEAAGVKRNVEDCTYELGSRFALLEELKKKCERESDVQAACRKFLRNAFCAAMYMRGWAGPGTPYPIQAPSSSVGGAGNPISEELVEGMIHITPSGELKVKDSQEGIDASEASDFVLDGVLISMTESHLLAAFRCTDSLPSHQTRKFVRDRALSSLPPLTTQGGRWPSGDLLHDVLFGLPSPTPSNLLSTSSEILKACELLTPIFYKTRPQWMVYEGVLA